MKATCHVATCDEPSYIAGNCKSHDARRRKHGDVQAHIPLRKRPRTGPPICQIPDCGEHPIATGLCATHYARNRRTGTTDLIPRVPKQPDPCAVDTCRDPAKAHGYCYGHYGRIKKTGDPRPHEPLRRYHRHNGALCASGGCPRRAVAVGMCAIHRIRVRYHGDDLAHMPIRARNAPPRPCSATDCVNFATSFSWCPTHYVRWRNTGSIMEDVPVQRQRTRAEIENSRCVMPRCPGNALMRGMCLRHYQQMLYRTATPAQIEHRRRLGREQANERRRRDPAADRARVRAWQKQNPERYRAIQARRRARRRDATVVRFTREQILAKVAYWGGRCWICGGSYEVIDHVKPLARGGAHMLSNLRPACRTCNLSKGGKWPYQPPPTGTV